MRYRSKRKEQRHRQIVELAAKEFRTHGFEGIGITNLMGALGLTHGGFYAHFADKEELISEACAVVFDQRLELMLGVLESGGFPAVLDHYLSESHRDDIATGCMLPSLAADVARRAPSSREAFTEKLTETYDVIAEIMPGETRAQKVEQISVMLAAMAGAVLLARVVSNPEMSDTILRSMRHHLLDFIEEG